MHLRELEIHGFKSFPRKISLSFGPGLTAVVGPNGTGKSNIADAIRWALGEQSARNLRGQRTEDVIFGGTPNRSRAGMASVTLTFDNGDGRLPLEYSEISITRRAYRSGENEYLINGAPVLLRDVQDLLRSVSLGLNGQVVVNQGQVDAALSLRPEERREMLEEAAGVSRHYAKRDQALARLDRTQRNLERLRDLYAELGPRLESLGRQAEVAERRGGIEDELNAALRTLLSHRLWQAEAASASAESDREKLAEELSKLEQLDSGAAGEQADGGRDEARAQVKEAAARAERLRSEAAERAAEARLAAQRAGFEESRIDDLRARSLEHGEAVKALEQAMAADQRAIDEAESSIEERGGGKADSGAKAVTAADPDTARAAVARARRAATELASEIARLQESERGLAARQAEAEADAASARADLVKLSERLESLAADAAKSSERARNAQAGADAARFKRAGASNAAGAARGALERVRTKLMEQRGAVEGLKAELNAIAAAGAESQAARSGAAALLENAETLHVRGLLRTGFGHVPAELTSVVEAALGHVLEDVLVDHVADLAPAAQLLREVESERLRLRPVQGFPIPGSRRWPFSHQPSGQGIVGTLDSLVRIKPDFRQVLEPLLQSVLVVDGLSTAIELRSAGKAPGFDIVTLDGDLVGKDGTVTVGGRDPERLAGLSERAVELELQLAQQEARLEAVEEEAAAGEAELRSKLQEEERLADDLEVATVAVAEAKSMLRTAEEESGLANRQTTWWRTLVERSESTLEEIHVRRGSIAERMTELGPKAQPARQAVADAERKLLEAQSASATGEAAMAAELERERLAHARNRLGEKAAALRRRRATLERAEVELQAAMKLREQALAGTSRLESQAAGLRGELEGATRAESEARERLANLERERERASLARMTREAELARLRGALQGAADRIEAARQRIGDLNGRALEELGQTRLEPARFGGSVTDLEGRIEGLRHLAFEIGPVNPLAPQQFEEERARLQDLETQIDDLERTSLELQKLSRDLDAAVRSEFMQTFEEIRAAFKQYFQVLLRGGEADMELTSPEEPGRGGVEISARLPGKRRQRLNALSGGERSLVAAALTFALVSVRAGPFCVLDEVDAALDDDNIVRFGQVLAEFASQTQFIVITHNPGTMELADAIYGVSMADDGVSQVVSIRLNGADGAARGEAARNTAGA